MRPDGRFALARPPHREPTGRIGTYVEGERRILSLERFSAAFAEISAWPGYRPTPLIDLPGWAGALGLGAIHYKDESHRFGLKSFKALGGAYAVLQFWRGTWQTGTAYRMRPRVTSLPVDIARFARK